MECRLDFSVSSNATGESVPSVENPAFEVVWRGSEVVEQCSSELSDLAAVEIDDGGICVFEC